MINAILLNQSPNGNGDYLTLIILIILALLSPAIICITVGLFLRKKKPKTAKTLFIIAGVYLVVGIGLCSVPSF
ncbi:MAG: hypothetical protein ACSHWV_03330 [Cellulophaga fucicola]|uniref:hypothetical protein n=1 Tax=Cellulophaga sp. RHA19 TaxID=1798237 RepID=UPI000C2BC78F|nr:hypothetical protein [Cellulophaga sp. RHA19]PKB42688.1 hypothetical protein AX016_0858 [Cellulophaga sp. RHA19]